ncbi:hypothetical protein HDV03_002127 [Kappamyces sp. JEL0829]|nr:hypothetical protein HDV03_002127 [Kappamyces sp. JEL0829]
MNDTSFSRYQSSSTLEANPYDNATLHAILIDYPKQNTTRWIGFDYNDASWWTAFIFTVGSVFWIVNGLFSFFDLPQALTVSTIFAFLGGTHFIIGGYFIYLEALNSEIHFLFGANVDSYPLTLNGWKWWGWRSLGDRGFAAGVTQFIGTIIFYIAVVSGIFTQTSLVYYWWPQVIGAFFLTVSSFIIMIEAQHKWYLLRPLSIGWHVGFWNVIGSALFMLSGLWGIYTFSTVTMTVYLSTFVGSISFLLGSYLQLFEQLNRHKSS